MAVVIFFFTLWNFLVKSCTMRVNGVTTTVLNRAQITDQVDQQYVDLSALLYVMQ